MLPRFRRTARSAAPLALLAASRAGRAARREGAGPGRTPARWQSATLKPMMNREQRIEYEILDCAFNADSFSAYITDTQTFKQLLERAIS